MTIGEEQTENLDTQSTRAAREDGPPSVMREVARLSEDGLSVEVARYDGAELIELRAIDPTKALNHAAALSEVAASALRNRARIGLAQSVA